MKYMVFKTVQTIFLLVLFNNLYADDYFVDKVFQFDYSYKFIGFPGDYSDFPIKSLIKNNVSEWMGYTLDTYSSPNRYINWGENVLISTGQGILIGSSEDLHFKGFLPKVSIEPNDTVMIDLTDGWNLITNPYNSPVPWQWVIDTNNLYSGNVIYLWNKLHRWETSNTLVPFEGYYFFNNQNLKKLKIPPCFGTGEETYEDQLEWFIKVFIYINNTKSDVIICGVNKFSYDSIDDLDLEKPIMLAEYNEIVIKRLDPNDNQKKYYYSDIRSPYAFESKWRFSILNKNSRSNQIELLFEFSENFPEEYRCFIADEQNQKIEELHDEAIYLIRNNGYINNYSLHIGKEADIDTSIFINIKQDFKMMPIYPNPANSHIIIPIVIKKNSSYDIEIYNMLGEKVKTLFSGELPSCEVEFLWTGNNDYDDPVASGLYFIKLSNEKSSNYRKVCFIE